jgi:glycosyltransferase involved in cell wall biosynthesis
MLIIAHDICYNVKDMEISIIIPVHNAGKYLERCLDSVVDSLSGIHGEIVIVNDNSSDNLLEIIQGHQKKYPKVISILNCQKHGAAAARNFGVQSAHGKYIWFIDADDYIAKDSIHKLLEKTKSAKADMVMMGAEKIHQDGTRLYLSAVDPKKPDYKSRFVRYGMGPWQVIIKREWWVDNNFQFQEGFIHEDMGLMSALILYTDNFTSIDEPLYFYCENKNSVLHKTKWDAHCFDIFPALENLYKKFTYKKAAKKYYDELEWFFIWNLLLDSAKDFAQFKEGQVGFARSRKMLKEYFPHWRKNRFLHQKPLKLKIKVLLNYYK